MKNGSRDNLVWRMAIAAMFIALTFGATFIAIPFGTSKVHLGNLACVLAGMLCGPLVGGIAGSVGMGLNDLFFYGPDTFIRTFIVKFILGFAAGLFFRLAFKKPKGFQYSLLGLSLLFFALFGVSLWMYLSLGPIEVGDRKVVVPLSLTIASPILAALLLTGFFLSRFRFSGDARAALTSGSIAMLINVVAEFALKIPLKMLFAELTFEGAVAYAVASLPSALVTASVTIVIAAVLLPPLKIATDRVNPFAVSEAEA
ncbi:MAG: ECF transporter S component [Bacilli bacterium]|nr:ECF transporter S component [Bacilli bacterium]